MIEIDHPWAKFLNARYECILMFLQEGKSYEEITKLLSMDPGQAESIVRACELEKMMK